MKVLSLSFSVLPCVCLSLDHGSVPGKHRSLQGLPNGVAPESLVIFAGIGSVVDELATFETPFAVRTPNYIAAAMWNCVASFSESWNDALTKRPPKVAVKDVKMHTTMNRAICIAQTFVTLAAFNFAESVANTAEIYSGVFQQLGIPDSVRVTPLMDDRVAACEGRVICMKQVASDTSYDPIIMGQIVAKQVYDFSLDDGFNQLGTDDGCQVNCRPYRDTTGYNPVNTPYLLKRARKRKNRWRPLLEDNGKGFFFYQEHVSPHIGRKAKFRFLPESDRVNRVAPPPNYSKSLKVESSSVIRRMALLNDEKKVAIEQFDDKIIVAIALDEAFIRKLVEENFQDPVFQSDSIVSLERLAHIIMNNLANDYDATVIAWKEKVNYDLVRPTTVIKTRFPGNVTTWAPGGVTTFPARDFEAYIRVMPHSEYISGSACIFQAQEDMVNAYLARLGLNATNFLVQLPLVRKGQSKVEPGLVPETDTSLSYPNMEVFAKVGSQSRLDGGMHFDASVSSAKKACSGIGDVVVQGTFALI